MIGELKEKIAGLDSELESIKKEEVDKKEVVLDSFETSVLYQQLEERDATIADLRVEVETLKAGVKISAEYGEPVEEEKERLAGEGEPEESPFSVIEYGESLGGVENDTEKSEESTSVSSSGELELEGLKDEISRLTEIIQKHESLQNADQQKMIEDAKREASKELEEKDVLIGNKELEIIELNTAMNNKDSELREKDIQLNEKAREITEKLNEISELKGVIEKQKAQIAEKIAQLEAVSLEIGKIEELRNERDEARAESEELKEITKELEETVNDYEQRLEGAAQKEEDSDNEKIDLSDVFPIINENSVLAARKTIYIREVGRNPWLEDILCYISVMLKKQLSGTSVEPVFVIVDPCLSDIDKLKYQDYGFVFNKLPSLSGNPETNICVTDYVTFPDLKAHLNINNLDFLIIVDRYGKSKPFVKRVKGPNYNEFNLANNADLLDLCKVPVNDTLIATYEENTVNSVMLPSDFSIRGKRDKISVMIQKKCFLDVIDSSLRNLFK